MHPECRADCVLCVQLIHTEHLLILAAFLPQERQYTGEYLEIMEDLLLRTLLGWVRELLLTFIRWWPGMPNVLEYVKNCPDQNANCVASLRPLRP